jgi:hypothetical protein
MSQTEQDTVEVKSDSEKVEIGCSCLLLSTAFGILLLSLAGAYSMVW